MIRASNDAQFGLVFVISKKYFFIFFSSRISKIFSRPSVAVIEAYRRAMDHGDERKIIT